jgi:hypothetical protein
MLAHESTNQLTEFAVLILGDKTFKLMFRAHPVRKGCSQALGQAARKGPP